MLTRNKAVTSRNGSRNNGTTDFSRNKPGMWFGKLIGPVESEKAVSVVQIDLDGILAVDHFRSLGHRRPISPGEGANSLQDKINSLSGPCNSQLTRRVRDFQALWLTPDAKPLCGFI